MTPINTIARLAISRRVLVAGTVLLVIVTCACLSYPGIMVRLHLRLISLGGIDNIRYQSGDDHGLPAAYIGLDNIDERSLQTIIRRLSLEKLDFYKYAGSHPPDWWPQEIRGHGDMKDGRRVAGALRASGDLVTYRFRQRIRDCSVGKTYDIDLYYFPNRQQVFYAKRWVLVACP